MLTSRAGRRQKSPVLLTPDTNTVVINLNKIDVAFTTLALTDTLAFTPLPMHIYQNMSPANVAADLQAHGDKWPLHRFRMHMSRATT